MDTKLLIAYFVLGGSIVALATYLGSQAKGPLAAFVALFPSITVVTLCTIYFGSGITAATSYFRGMLQLLPAWLLYVLSVMFLLPRLGLVPSLAIGISLYLAAALVTMRLAH